MLLTFSPWVVAQGSPWGPGKLCPVWDVAPQHSRLCGHLGNSHMWQLHPRLPRRVPQHLQGLGRQW